MHHAHVTYADVNYTGSIEIGQDLMAAVGLEVGEAVQVWAVDKPVRLETYVIAGKNGIIGLNGGAAQYFEVGDRVVIAAFCWADTAPTPQMVLHTVL